MVSEFEIGRKGLKQIQRICEFSTNMFKHL